MTLCIAQPLPVTRCGRMSLPGARLSSLREMSCCCVQSEQEREERETKHHEHLSNSAQCVVIISKIQAIFSTYNSINTTLLQKIYFGKTSFGAKLQCQNLELVFHRLIKKFQSFMIHNSEIYFNFSVLSGKWGGHIFVFIFVAPAKSNNK